MTVLNETSRFFVNEGFLLSAIVSACLMAAFIEARTCYTEPAIRDKFLVLIFVFVGCGIFFTLLTASPTTQHRYTYYEVIFDDSYPVKKVLTEYELVDKRGEIYTLRKEVVDDSTGHDE